MHRRQEAAACAAMAFLIGLAACRPGPAPSPTASQVPSNTPLPSPSATATPITPTPTPTCTSSSGSLETQELPSEWMPNPLLFIIHLPPCYEERTDLRYPVLYLFHGQFYDQTQWVRVGAPAAEDRLVTAGEIQPFIIVMPFDPYPDQPYEYGFDEAFLKDLLPYIDSHYRTRAERAYRAVGGLSRGSSWALHFGLSEPELFGKFGMHSPIIFASEGVVVEKWLDIIPPDQMPQIYLDISENDQDMQNARWLEKILTIRGIPHEWHLNTGFHDEQYWSAHVEEYMRWYAIGWEAAP